MGSVGKDKVTLEVRKVTEEPGAIGQRWGAMTGMDRIMVDFVT